MTKQTNWNGKEVLLVEVPEDCIKPVIIGRRDVDNLADEEWMPFETLPEGDWQFAFADPLHPTEQEAGEWVDKESRIEIVDYNAGGGGRITITSCKDYMALENGYEYDLCTIESLHSRIRAEGFEHPERVIMLIKK